MIAATIGVLTITFLAVGVLAIRLTTTSLRGELDDALLAKAESIAARIEQDDGVVTNELDPSSFAASESYEVWVDGRVFAKSTSLGATDLVPDDHRVIRGDRIRQITLRTVPRAEPRDHAPVPPVQIVYARATDEVFAAVHHMAGVMVIAGAIGIALCAAMLLVATRAALAPVRELATAIAAIRAEDPAARLGAAAPPAELVPIAAGVDELLERVARALARQRELTAEVGHELRTPLAGLRATLELALDRDRSPERYRAALTQSLAITLDTQRVVEAVLSLARLDAGHARADVAPIDLDQLVLEIKSTIDAKALARRISIVTELEPVSLATDRDKLRVVLVNLFDNAVTYADEGGEVRMTLTGHTLRIANTGCTLTPDQVARVFDRFWRADAARGAGHVGIGLALCRKLLDLLGGSIEARVLGESFVATVQLP